MSAKSDAEETNNAVKSSSRKKPALIITLISFSLLTLNIITRSMESIAHARHDVYVRIEDFRDLRIERAN